MRHFNLDTPKTAIEKTFTEKPSLAPQTALAKLHKELKLTFQVRNQFLVQNADTHMRKLPKLV